MSQARVCRWGPWTFALLVFVGLTYAYLYPGSRALVEGRHDIVLSDDTDMAPLPQMYANILSTWKAHPSWLFYGTVYSENVNPQTGTNYWMSWNERWLTVWLSPFIPLEQLSTGIAFVILILNALLFLMMARYFRWPWPLAFGLAIAFAFCPFVRARAKVHMDMAAIYHLPAIFLALGLIVRGRSCRSLAAAAALLLLACSVIHYFLVTSIFLSPFFLAYLFVNRTASPHDVKSRFWRLGLASLPAFLFLLFNYTHMLPSSARMSAKQAVPHSVPTNMGLHPFLSVYAAHPIDYLGGDIALHNSATDWNPLREKINEQILTHLGHGNSHERTNGIRWSLLVLALVALIVGRRRLEPWYFFIFGLFCFCLSLSPQSLGYGPSAWLYDLVPQIRVPSRAGICVHFAVLMLVGFWLTEVWNKKSSRRWGRWAICLLPLLMVAEDPPLVQGMPMSPVRPAFAELQPSAGPCGVGLYVPFVNDDVMPAIYYHFQQRLRGSDCTYLNAFNGFSPEASALLRVLPPTPEFIHDITRNLIVKDQLLHLARCTPLSWMVFDESLPQDWAERTCHDLGWHVATSDPRLCLSPLKGAPMVNSPSQCL